MKVLVIEQDRELRQLVVATLLSADFDVEICSADKVLEQVRVGQPVILVAGWSSRWLLTSPTTGKVLTQTSGLNTILLLNADAGMEQVKEGLRAGADDLVFQPRNLAELIMRVGIAERILNLKSIKRESLSLNAPKFQSRKQPVPSPRL
jgi:DNA-binding response OmpR family regulator